MPADSERVLPALPHTWRPLGVRVAVVGLGLVLVVVCAAAWFGFDQSVRDRVSLLQRATLLAFAIGGGVCGWALCRARVTAEMESLVVVNGFRRREFEWEEVLSVHLPPGAPWATLDLADGTTISAMAFQGSDGRRAQDDVRQLRSLLDRRTGD